MLCNWGLWFIPNPPCFNSVIFPCEFLWILGKENAIDGIGVRFPGSLLWHRECRGSSLILGRENAIDGIGVRIPGSLLHLSVNPIPLPLLWHREGSYILDPKHYFLILGTGSYARGGKGEWQHIRSIGGKFSQLPLDCLFELWF
jgi:hypothetical protein